MAPSNRCINPATPPHLASSRQLLGVDKNDYRQMGATVCGLWTRMWSSSLTQEMTDRVNPVSNGPVLLEVQSRFYS
jgi:hypothetical protein